MIARSFKSVGWVAAVGAAALGCYMLSLQVATERAELARVEAQIIATKQEIRSLQTELGTRGRLSQLEHWNAEVLALAAPSSGQFLQDEFRLASFDQNGNTPADPAEVRLASAEAERPAAQIVRRAVAPAAVPAPSGQATIHRASFTTLPIEDAPRPTRAPKPAAPKAVAPKPTVKAAPPKTSETKLAKLETSAKPAKVKPSAESRQEKSVHTKLAAKSAVAKPAGTKPAEPKKVAAKQIASKSTPTKSEAKPAPTKLAKANKPAGRIDAKLAREIGAAAQAEKSGTR